MVHWILGVEGSVQRLWNCCLGGDSWVVSGMAGSLPSLRDNPALLERVINVSNLRAKNLITALQYLSLKFYVKINCKKYTPYANLVIKL